jgi:hypothetical protein
MAKGAETKVEKKAAPAVKKSEKVEKKSEKKVAVKGEKKKRVHKYRPAPAPGPAKAAAKREVEDWISVGLQSTSTAEKKFVQEKALKDWLLANCPVYSGEDGKHLVKRQVPKVLVKLLGEKHVTQYKGKWKVSQSGLVKYGDITVKK